MRQWLEHETGTVKKNWRGRTAVALVYPNTYMAGMSSLGFQTVYRLFNSCDRIVCERVFTSDQPGQPALSLESNRPLSRFAAIAFSLSFENDFSNVLGTLEQGGVPPVSGGRNASHPLVIAGGIAAGLNPEPLAPFVDCFLIGEAEALIPQFLARFDPDRPRQELLQDLAQNLPGAYVPAFYTPAYNQDGTLRSFTPQNGAPERVRRVYAPDAASWPTCSSLVTPHTSFDDTYLVEVSRGCGHGCRFCAAGHVCRPPRFRKEDLLRACMDHGLGITKKIGLLGAAVSDLPCLDSLCKYGMEQGASLSFSSFRANAMSQEIVSALAKSGTKTATLAPDAGSERMRQVIKKGITEDDVLVAAESLVAAGIPNLKLYFMVGLPTETEKDVDAIVDLVKKTKHAFLKSSRARGRIGRIQVSLNCFVPKPFTPFQWAAMDEVSVLRDKIKKVKNGLAKVANVDVTSDVPRWAAIQGLLSRGDRRVAGILLAAHKNQGNWPKTFKETPVNPDFYTLRERAQNELFAWDFIDHGLAKDHLFTEYARARGLAA